MGLGQYCYKDIQRLQDHNKIILTLMKPFAFAEMKII